VAYDDSIYRRRDSDTTDPGTQEDYRTGFHTDFPVGDFRDSDYADTAQRRAVPPAVLDDVFDDPSHGDPGRDRMAVHIVWEVLLLAAAAGVAYLLQRLEPGALEGARLDTLLVSAAALGLLAIGTGLTLRAGAVNLALGPVAVASALHFAENGDRGVLQAVGPAALIAFGLGLALGLFVVILHVPGWAASIAAALVVVVYIEQRAAPVDVQGAFDPTDHAVIIFGGVAALAVLGGLFGSVKAIRRPLGRFRPVSDPARRRGTAAAALTAGSIAVSMPLAAVAGVLIAAAASGPVAPTNGFEWTGLALGAALLGGTSAFGRRGGVLGTVLAVALITLFVDYQEARNWDMAILAVAAGAIVGGLLVTRLVETFGRPKSATGDTSWRYGAGRGTPEITDSWSSSLPAQSTDARNDRWDTERWRDNGH
jgi:ribose/xylose/arabinose/galactoside ABC-type transport system permease subunit